MWTRSPATARPELGTHSPAPSSSHPDLNVPGLRCDPQRWASFSSVLQIVLFHGGHCPSETTRSHTLPRLTGKYSLAPLRRFEKQVTEKMLVQALRSDPGPSEGLGPLPLSPAPCPLSRATSKPASLTLGARGQSCGSAPTHTEPGPVGSRDAQSLPEGGSGPGQGRENGHFSSASSRRGWAP